MCARAREFLCLCLNKKPIAQQRNEKPTHLRRESEEITSRIRRNRWCQEGKKLFRHVSKMNEHVTYFIHDNIRSIQYHCHGYLMEAVNGNFVGNLRGKNVTRLTRIFIGIFVSMCFDCDVDCLVKFQKKAHKMMCFDNSKTMWQQIRQHRSWKYKYFNRLKNEFECNEKNKRCVDFWLNNLCRLKTIHRSC